MIVPLEIATLQDEMNDCVSILQLYELKNKYIIQEKYELCRVIQNEIERRQSITQ